MKDVILSYDSPKYQYIFIEVINMYFAYVRTKFDIHVFIAYIYWWYFIYKARWNFNGNYKFDTKTQLIEKDITIKSNSFTN